jgi:Papain family cysteine protease
LRHKLERIRSQPPQIPPDASFDIPSYQATDIKDGVAGLNNLRTVIASGMPLVYGTFLYEDFPKYEGMPTPYVGNGIWLINKRTRKKAGHVMLIISYNDAYADGAVLIQNSFGPHWGMNGFVWMAYKTLQATAQGVGIYVPTPGPSRS